jgi:hypothetical protein
MSVLVLTFDLYPLSLIPGTCLASVSSEGHIRNVIVNVHGEGGGDRVREMLYLFFNSSLATFQPSQRRRAALVLDLGPNNVHGVNENVGKIGGARPSPSGQREDNLGIKCCLVLGQDR